MKKASPLSDNNEELDWKVTNRDLLLNCPVFKVYASDRQSRQGRTARFFYLDLADWVTVVPGIKVGDEVYFVMVRQFRHGVERQMLEFPAGVMNRGESPEQAARRELLEETGFEVEDLTLLGECRPNPALMNNRNFTFFARIPSGVNPGPLSLDDNELLENVMVERRELEYLITTGKMPNAMMLQAYLFYQFWERRG